jgi:hypothetical protein
MNAKECESGLAFIRVHWRPISFAPWIIASIEGFSTLAVEVIAIRLAIPVVGSSVTLTGVLLGVVLFALSAGYWRGGILSARWDRTQTRARLARNLLLAAVLYGGLAFPFEAPLLEKLLDAGLSLPLAIGATASLLYMLPIYLASQTVPMLAELTNVDGKAGKASGKVLFYSTVGSVAGGIVTPVWLFPSIGVARSTWVVCGLLAVVACAMATSRLRVAAAAAIVIILGAGAAPARSSDVFSFDSAYQSIRIAQEGDQRILIMGGSRSSGIYAGTGETSFEYVRAAEKVLEQFQPERTLVIGAAGFTFPRDIARLAAVKQVDAVDVDPLVGDIAQQYFLKSALPAKVRFLPLSARYAVHKLHGGARYGFTFIDAYFGKGIPDELVTVEFFRDVRLVSERTAANMVLDREMDSAFARNTLESFREAFGGVWVKQVKSGDDDLTNMLVTDFPFDGAARWSGAGEAYHDDRNNADRDHIAMVW